MPPTWCGASGAAGGREVLVLLVEVELGVLVVMGSYLTCRQGPGEGPLDKTPV